MALPIFVSTPTATAAANPVAGVLTLSAASASQIIPGATSLSLRTTANDADNLIILDAGTATFRNTVTVAAGGLAVTGPNTLTGTATSGGATLLTLSPAAHTAVTAEVNAILVNSQTLTITGGYATQRFALFNQPTISAGSALTAATAATFAIANAPTPGGSALITRPIALWIQNGQVGIDSASGLSTATTANVGPALAITGTWITGGSNTTTKPHVLIEPSGTTSTGWVGTLGTAFGINAASGFTGSLVDLQTGGVSRLVVQGGGNVVGTGNAQFAGVTATGTLSAANAALLVTTGSNVNLAVLTQAVASSGNRVMLTATGGAHTGQTIAEEIDVNFNLARNVTFTSGGGTIATQRVFLIQAPTYLATTNAVTITAAATLAITGPPIASTNITLTAPNNSSLWLASSIATVAGGSLGAAISIGVTSSVPTIQVRWGSGAPTIAAPKGSLYMRTDGTTTNDRMYVNTDASTTWTALTTVA